MALVKYGPVVGVASGSVGAVTYSHNRGGAYIRSLAIPTNPNTAAQTLTRNRLSGLSQGWKLITPGQRSAWGALATSLPQVNALGDTFTLSGQQLYIGYNQFRLYAGLTIQSDAPALDAAPIITPGTLTVTGSATPGSRVMSLTYGPVIAAGQSLRVYATPPCSAGIQYFKQSQYRLIKVYAYPQTSPINLLNDYQNIYGTLGATVAASKISLRITPVSANGLPGAQVRVDAIATSV
jgi:hypothetical protein